MGDISKFKNRLKELRKNYDMTQEELAKKLGVVRTAIANYETGRTNPDPETLSMIANIFNTSTDYLLGRTNINSPFLDSKNEDEDNYNWYTNNIIEKEIENLSPESQEDLRKYIELLRIKDMQERNKNNNDELATLD